MVELLVRSNRLGRCVRAEMGGGAPILVGPEGAVECDASGDGGCSFLIMGRVEVEDVWLSASELPRRGCLWRWRIKHQFQSSRDMGWDKTRGESCIVTWGDA